MIMEKEFFNETPIITPLDCDNDCTSITDPTLATTDEVIPAETPCDTTPDTTPGTPAEAPTPLVPTTPVCEPETPNSEGEVTIGCFFGTLQESVTIVWRYHLKTRKYSTHKILKDFYDKALDIVDDLIEQWQGVHSVIEQPFINCITGDDKSSETYLYSLKGFIESNSHILGDDSEIKSTLSIKEIFDYIRMLDGEGYPNAFIKFGEYKLLFSGAELKDGVVSAKIKLIRDGDEYEQN